ncbi:MAG: dihydroorotate dehydrogenase electron transfer subunit [Candidatus Omnitrophica bacterium]|nr:dihydroorotate dehydrogenase electron transfer subunit [Candidatus Omnitrophota bacterium]MDD5574765.1 dihydroorotate dehydrogenase electron transfer subunit [Candidatus Omnitrophota bacterium]
MKLDILSNTFLRDKYLLLELRAPEEFVKPQPGQFLHLRIEDSSDPLLRRPLSVHDAVWPSSKTGSRKPVIRVLYEVVGKGTSLLSEKRPLTQVDALGPLGNGFDLGKILRAGQVYIVAGGMGVAPLFFLAKTICESQKAKGKRQKIVVLIGGRNKDHIVREKEFKDLGCEVHVATEDGSKGFKGRVTELLNSFLLKAADSRPPTLCACGPKLMLAAVAGIAQQKGLAAQVSLEEFMGCGLGACLGCVILTTRGYRRICHDGPVFDASEVIWTE